MNTHDFELPPLPPLRITPDVEPIDYPEVAKALMDYARTAVEADRKCRSESNYPIKYYKQGGVVYAVHGTSSINYVECLLAEIADLTAAPEAAREDAWQPIETAPRDGTTVVVYFKGHGAMTVTWEDPYGDDPEAAVWCVTDHKHGPYPVRGYHTGDDTHWHPLPAPPAIDEVLKGE